MYGVSLAKRLSCMKAFEISDFQEDEIDATRTQTIRTMLHALVVGVK
jgi:hypothetical protein